MIDRGTIVYNKVWETYFLSLGISVDETVSYDIANFYCCTSKNMTSKAFETAYALISANCKEQYWKRSAEIFGQVYYDLGKTYDSSIFNQPFDTTKVFRFNSLSLFYFELDKNVSDKIEEVDAWLLKNKIIGIEIPECEPLEYSLKRNKDMIDGYKWNFKQTQKNMIDIILKYSKYTGMEVEMYEKCDKLYFVSYRSRLIRDVVDKKMTATKKMAHYLYAFLSQLSETPLTKEEIFHPDARTKVICIEDFNI